VNWCVGLGSVQKTDPCPCPVQRYEHHALSSSRGLVTPPAPVDCRPELARGDPADSLPPTDDDDGGRDPSAGPSTGVRVDPRGERVAVALESVR